MSNPPVIDGRVPPHDLEAEAIVLSAIMLDATGAALDEVSDLLTSERFYCEAHRRIYEALVDLRAKGQPYDVAHVSGWLLDRQPSRLAQVGGHEYLVELLGAAATANLRSVAKRIAGKWRARQIIVEAQRIAATGYLDYGDVDEYAAASAAALHALAHSQTESTLQHIGGVLNEGLREVAAAAKSGRTLTGTPTGFTCYDRITAGLHNGELTVVAARPGMGKTAWAMNVAVNVAKGQTVALGDDVVVFSLETLAKQLGKRMVCSEGKIDLGRLRRGEMHQSDWTRLVEFTKSLSVLPLFIDKATSLTVSKMRATLRKHAAEIARLGANEPTPRARRIGTVVIDYLQLVKPDGKHPSREQEISEISRSLKELALELDVPVIALSQLNRAVESRGGEGKRPQLSDLRESGAIEQDADNVTFIYRGEYYKNQKTKGAPDHVPGVAELIVAKQRNGPCDTAVVRFDGAYTRFDNVTDEYDEREAS